MISMKIFFLPLSCITLLAVAAYPADQVSATPTENILTNEQNLTKYTSSGERVSASAPGNRTVPYLTEKEKNSIAALADTLPATTRTQFNQLYAQWRRDWTDYRANTADVVRNWPPENTNPKPPFSKDPYDWVKTKSYRSLLAMGRNIIPLLLTKMTLEAKPDFVLRLYCELQNDPSLLDKGEYYPDQASRFRHVARLWLERQTWLTGVLLPSEKAQLHTLCQMIPEPVRKELTWRYNDWRRCRAAEIQHGVAPEQSTCYKPIADMGSSIIPLLLEKIISTPGGWHALPLLERILKEDLPKRTAEEHPQAYAHRIAKLWLAGEYSLFNTSTTPSANCPPPSPMFSTPDIQQLKALAEQIPLSVRDRFDAAFSIWSLAGAPDTSLPFVWEEILPGGSQVDELEEMGEDALTLLALEMAENPLGDYVLPLYRELQKNRTLVPHPSHSNNDGLCARRAAAMWLETHRPDNTYIYAETKHTPGSLDGPQQFLPKGYAQKLAGIVAATPDQDKDDFTQLYSVWLQTQTDCPQNESDAIPGVRERNSKMARAEVLKGVRALQLYAVPLLLDRMAFSHDGEHARTILKEIAPETAARSFTTKPWLRPDLAIIVNWLDTQESTK